MFTKRMWYLSALLLCGAVYIAYGEWLAWLLLAAVLALPWLSLALSLPAILNFRVSPTGADVVTQGEDASLWLLGSCSVPMPPFRGRIRLTECLTGEQWEYDPDKGLPTGHCGGIRASIVRDRVCDYLGLFSFRVRKKEEKVILIRPRPLEDAKVPDLREYAAARWRVKPGGGYAENHELRPYRPGDSMNGVHWKLSAKTGSLMVREPVEPDRDPLLLTMDLQGTKEELDRKFGRLLWLGKLLLSREIPFEIRVLAGRGILSLPVTTEAELQKSIDGLLLESPAASGTIRDQSNPASRQYYIGGDSDAV